MIELAKYSDRLCEQYALLQRLLEKESNNYLSKVESETLMEDADGMPLAK
jgi:hypothetical protein